MASKQQDCYIVEVPLPINSRKLGFLACGVCEVATVSVYIPYSLDQTPLSISRRSQIVGALPDELNEIDAAFEY